MAEVRIPGSKSITARALFLGACSSGLSYLQRPLLSDDTEAFTDGLTELGYQVQNSGSDDLLYVAPAIEYNWSASMGVIAGARITAAGRNVGATATPVAAINMYF